jgi:hypothetical protein
MVRKLKVRRIGNSADGGFRITATNPQFADKMKAAMSLSRRYRHALKELAK